MLRLQFLWDFPVEGLHMSALSVFQRAALDVGTVSNWRFTGTAGIEGSLGAGEVGGGTLCGNLYVQRAGLTQVSTIGFVGLRGETGIGPLPGSGSISLSSHDSGGSPIVMFQDRRRPLSFSEFGGIAVLFTVSAANVTIPDIIRNIYRIARGGLPSNALGVYLVCFNPTVREMVVESFTGGGGPDNVVDLCVRSSRASGLVWGRAVATPGVSAGAALVACRPGIGLPL